MKNTANLQKEYKMAYNGKVFNINNNQTNVNKTSYLLPIRQAKTMKNGDFALHYY